MRLRILFIVSFFMLFNTPTALSLPCSTTTLALAAPNRGQHPPQPLSTQEISIQARMPPLYAFAGWHRGFNERGIALIDPARVIGVSVIVGCAIIIVRLFSNILDTCLNLWAYNPPANQVVIEAGNMRLEFGCSMEPVPWEFIADYAKSQKDATNRGFAPGYAKEWWFNGRRSRSRLCYVGIRIVPDGGKAVRPGKRAA